MLNHDQRPNLTLEDLLHLKRAERPSPDFWNRFENDLRQKQLAALLQRRPWWHRPALVSRRVLLPLGGAAAVAVALVAARTYLSPVSAPAPAPRVAATHVAARRIEPVAVAAVRPAPVEAPAKAVADPVAVVERTVAALSDQLPDHAADLTPWSAPRPEDTPSSRTIAASLARLEATEPDLANTAMGGPLPGDASRLQAGALPAMFATAAVASGGARRSHLLAQLDGRRFTPEPQAPDMVRERLARRLADSDFSDDFSRVGLDRGGVSVRF